MCDTLISIRRDSVGHRRFHRAPPPWLIVQYPAILQSGNGNLEKGEYWFSIYMHFIGWLLYKSSSLFAYPIVHVIMFWSTKQFIHQIAENANARTSQYRTAQWLQFIEAVWVFFSLFWQCNEMAHNKLFLGSCSASSICTHLFSDYLLLPRKDYTARLEFTLRKYFLEHRQIMHCRNWDNKPDSNYLSTSKYLSKQLRVDLKEILVSSSILFFLIVDLIFYIFNKNDLT